MTDEDSFDFQLPLCTPRLWIKELALYGRKDAPKAIRTIPLRPGLNIIQGKDRIEDTERKPRNGVGHGVGKTLLCRLVRYLFGEKAFGKKKAMDEVRWTFRTGYVGAVVVVAGEEWRIVRAYDGSFHRAAQMESYEVLVEAEEGEAYDPKHFLERLTGHMATSAFEGPPPEWPALLAWCSRDQEARHKKPLQWRIPESQSLVAVEPDLALRTVRAVLGIGGHMREKEQQRVLAQAQVDSLSKQLEERRALLERQRDREARAIASLIPGLGDAVSSDDGIFDAAKQVEERTKAIEEELEVMRGKVDVLLPQLDALRARRKKLSDRLRSTREALESSKKKQGLFTAPGDGDRKPDDPCDYGHVDFGECEHRKDYVEKLRQDREKRERNAEAPTTDLDAAERDVAVLERQVADADREVASVEGDRRKLFADEGRLRVERDQLQERSAKHDFLKRSLNAPEDDEVSSNLLRERGKQAELVASLTVDLDTLTETQTEHVARFGKLMDWAAKQIIGEEMTCEVFLDSTKLLIDLTEGDGGEPGGEHYETTMKVLLLDLTGMLSGAVGWSLHPGVLIHDSPKEADMQDSLYRGLLDLLSLLSSAKDGKVPFQYIITTSASTPQELGGFVRDELWRGGDGEGFLFRQRLKKPQQTDAFETEEVKAR